MLKSHQETREQNVKRVLEQTNQAVALMDKADGGPNTKKKKRMKRKEKAVLQRDPVKLCKDRARQQNQKALRWIKRSTTAASVDTSDAVELMVHRWEKDIVPPSGGLLSFIKQQSDGGWTEQMMLALVDLHQNYTVPGIETLPELEKKQKSEAAYE